ncbi:MAG: vitamin B12-dependent ribonucleotide reductase, partial [Candidatus Acidiferrales bacterium]
DLLHKMAESTWQCGDPGMQYDTTINRWHTCKATDRINASNPCSEYMFLDDTACNLASLNLLKFLGSNGQFDTDGFKHAVDVTITAQEILVDNASYPTDRIARNSHDYRPLGLGYANLGALLMSLALPYDSDGGRDYCGAITALMTGEAYAQSARIAERMGAFGGYLPNRDSMLDVIRMHRDSLRPIKEENVQPSLLHAAQDSWDSALELGEKYGYKNSQVSVLAPTGTIGFMMDCDTTGIEPDLALVKQKRLVGGGVIKIVNNTVPQALMKLGYGPESVAKIVDYIDANGKIEGAPGLKPEHLAVFDCSLAPMGGGRSISWRGHLQMMAAAQPFLSGAISKTINMPEESTVEDIMDAYIDSWKLGIKAVAIYRDNSKRSQPLSAAGKKEETKAAAPAPVAAAAPIAAAEPLVGATIPTGPMSPEQQELFARMRRHKLPDERSSITHKFSIGGHEGYLTVGRYPDDGKPGEIFIKMAKEGSTLSGIMDAFALSVSIALQYGVPLRALVDKFCNSRFEPSGYTGNPEIRYAKSVVDYIGRWLGGKFISTDYLDREIVPGVDLVSSPRAVNPAEVDNAKTSADMILDDDKVILQNGRTVTWREQGAPYCSECGMRMTPNGSCYKCSNCGSTSGCS